MTASTILRHVRHVPDMKKFHEHLDECSQCREHPFNLCSIGHEIFTGDKVDPYALDLGLDLMFDLDLMSD